MISFWRRVIFTVLLEVCLAQQGVYLPQSENDLITAVPTLAENEQEAAASTEEYSITIDGINSNAIHSISGNTSKNYNGNPPIGNGTDPLALLVGVLGGVPGADYPILSSVPDTGFTCKDRIAGYYADVDPEARCQVFHICQHDQRKDSFLCPNGTVFNQEYLVCDWWYNFNCSTADQFFDVNFNLGQSLDNPNEEQKAEMGTNTTGNVDGFGNEIDNTLINGDENGNVDITVTSGYGSEIYQNYGNKNYNSNGGE